MSEFFWTSPEKAYKVLADLKKPNYILRYELAPTGLVHPGILRTLIRLNTLRNLLVKGGLNVISVLRLNDRYVLKSSPYLSNSSPHINSQLKNVPSPEPGFSSYFDWSKADIQKSIEMYGITIDKVLLVSDMYQSNKFKKLIKKVLLKKTEVLRIISDSQDVPPRIFHPLCTNCQKMYYDQVSDISLSGEAEYHCKNCGHESKFSVYDNQGLLAFKIETALTWNFLGITMDFHGLNHIKAVECSAKIYTLLFHRRPPLSYVVNLTIGDNHKVVHKSLYNFIPVTKLSMAQKEKLKGILSKTPDHRLLDLPHI